MKKRVTLAIAVVLMLFATVSVFSFDWISFPNTETDMMAQVSAGYGSLVIVPIGILPIGAAFEVGLPFVEGLSAGMGASFISVDYDPSGDTYDATAIALGAGAYGKYIFLSDDQMQEMAGLPLVVGAAAGFGWRFEATNTTISGYSTSGWQALAVALVGYKGSGWIATMYAGLIDQGFGYSAEFAFSLSDTMHLGLFYIPLIGLGATFTLQF